MDARPLKQHPTIQKTEEPDILMLARKARKARAQCSNSFPKHVFRDTAWDIMLELFIERQEGRSLCVKDVMAISGDSATGTMRRLEGLEAAELITRRFDQRDHRRTLVLLSEKGTEAMNTYLGHLFRLENAASDRGAATRPVTFSPAQRDATS